MREILREPSFPAEEFETAKRRMVSSISSGSTEPTVLARNKLNHALSPYPSDDVRYVPTIEERLERARQVTLEQIKVLYETQLGGSHAELAVVGDFDPASTLGFVKAMLSGWESNVPYERIDRKVADYETGSKEDLVTPDKASAVYLAELTMAMSDKDPDYPGLRIANFIFGGSTLSSRLGDRIRERDGLSYGASSSLAVSSRDRVASLTVSVSTNPANIGKVTAAVMEELERFLKDGPTDKEVAEAKQAFVEAQKLSRTADAAIAAQIVSNLNTARTFAFVAEQEKAILALTPEMVGDAFRKHVDPRRLVIIRAGDFPK